MTSHEWTAEMIKAFTALHQQKPQLAFVEIAKQMSEQFNITLTRNACIGKARRLGLVTRSNIPRSNLEKKRIRLMKSRIDTPIAPIEVMPPVDRAEGLDIYQLREGDCHWPLGETFARPPFRYCGGPAVLGRPYCNKHIRKAYNFPRDR